MSKRLVALVAVAAFVPATPSVAPAAAASAHMPVAVVAKTCSRGFKHAVIGGNQKCLRRGEFCAHRYRRQYHRYGYRCVKRDSRGNYHLT